MRCVATSRRRSAKAPSRGSRGREVVDGGSDATDPIGHIPFTPRAKKVLELALREALALQHKRIGTEHILLGLIRERDGLAAELLAQRDVSADRVRVVVKELLSGN